MPQPFRATFVTRARPRPGHAESTLLVVRERVIGDGMRENMRMRTLAREAAGITLELSVGTDFANLFEVKEHGEVRLAPIVPAAYLPLRLDNVEIGGSPARLEVDADGFRVDGLPDGVSVVAEPRRPITALRP